MRETFLFADRRPPLTITPETTEERTLESLEAWIQEQRHGIARKLEQVGAVLFRGFHVSSACDFHRASRAFRPELRDYIEGHSPRKKIADGIYTSTHYPASETITLHNELAFTNDPPRFLFFFCETPPIEQGETPILDGRYLLTKLPSQVVDAFTGRGILYISRLHGGAGLGKSWKESFATADRNEVESHLDREGTEYEWLPEDTLQIRHIRPALSVHPATRERVWFNNACVFHRSDKGEVGEMIVETMGEQALPTDAFFENGDPIDASLLDTVRRTSWAEASFFPWSGGDVLFLDNYLAAHGRNSFSGERRVLVAMGS